MEFVSVAINPMTCFAEIWLEHLSALLFWKIKIGKEQETIKGNDWVVSNTNSTQKNHGPIKAEATSYVG